MSIDWSKIKKGHKGFEILAVDFVNEKEKKKNGFWKHTKDTRDNNHDAIMATGTKSSDDEIAIFVGFSTDVDIWWMEAKYSSTKLGESQRLPRYRLDATIVTAILSKNISKVVFVSNLNIAAKTICDIRKALISSGSCKEVIFYTKEHIESWLLKKDFQQFEKYFNYSYDEYITISIQPYNSVEEMTVYNIGDNLFQEPLNIVYSGFVYEICFSFTVYQEYDAALIQATNAEDISLQTLHLSSGTSVYTSKIRIPEKLHQESFSSKDVEGEYKKVLPITLTYELTNCITNETVKVQIIPQRSIELVDSKNFYIDIGSQSNLREELLKSTLESINDIDIKCTLVSVFGKSGIGKSFLLQQYKIHLLNHYNVICLSYVFSGDQTENMKFLKKLVFNIFFPYICYSDLDKKYVDELKANYPKLSEEFWRFVYWEKDFDTFMQICKNKNFVNKILPNEISINMRILILDDLHKLNEIMLSCVFTLIRNFVQYDYSVYCILVSQSELDLSQYRLTKKQNLISKELTITQEDIRQVFKSRISFADSIDTTILFGSIIEIVYFIKYLSTINNSINNYDDFRIAYHTFKSTGILKQEVIFKFKNVFEQHPYVEEVCSAIYYSNPGIPFSTIMQDEIYQKAIELLIQNELVKKDENDYYTIWHDYYRTIYIEHFPLKDNKILEVPIKSMLDIKSQFELKQNKKTFLNKAEQYLKECYSEQKFYSIYYILENIFSNIEARKQYKNRVPNEDFYLLFGYFCYANANAGTQYTGFSLFEQLYKETCNSKYISVQCINYISLWEMINSLYEASDYAETRRYISIFNNMPQKTKDKWVYLYEWDYHSLQQSVNSIDLLIASEEGVNCLKKVAPIEKLPNKDVAFSSYRIILSNFVNDFDAASHLLRKYNTIIQNEEIYDLKTKYMYDFTVKFLDCMNNDIDIGEVITANELLKNTFSNDYNRHIYIISILALLKKGLSLCESYSTEYLKVARPMKKRQKAFREAFGALVNLYKGNKEKALSHLKQQERYLAESKTYLPVILNNISYLNNNSFSINDVMFYTGNNMHTEKYYIDIRMLY